MTENLRYLKEEQKFLERASEHGISPARSLKTLVEMMLEEDSDDI